MQENQISSLTAPGSLHSADCAFRENHIRSKFGWAVRSQESAMSNVTATSSVPSIHWNPVRHATPQQAKSISPRRRWARPLPAPPVLWVLRPLVGASALILIAFALMWAVPGLIDSSEQRSLHRAPVHSDATTIQLGISACPCRKPHTAGEPVRIG